MTAIFVAFFGVVIAVNLYMARLATGTFSGVVVDNSYVASQHFNRWLDAADNSKALGWSVDATRTALGQIAVTLTGAPADAAVTGDARHPLGQSAPIALRFTRAADGRFLSDAPLPAGRWRLRIAVRSGEKHWRGEFDIQ